jgi:hypothetical protein
MLVESGSSGGAHAYWKIAKPLAATRVVEATGELAEPIERANLRLVHRLGVGADGKPDVCRPGVRRAFAGDAPRRHCQRQDPRKRSSR